MRNMRSSLPVFIFIGLALFTMIGVMVLQTTTASASAEVNNTSSEEYAVGMYTVEYGIAFGIGALLLIVAAYFALKALI